MSEKKQKSQKYWRRRAIQFEKDWFNRSQKTIEKKLADHYQKALNAIQDDILKLYGSFAKDNGLDFDEAKKLLNSQEYRRWRMSMQEYLQQIAGGDIGLERELNTLAMRPRINRLEKLYSETLQELDKLGRNVDADIKNFLADGYTGTYARDIFDLVKVGGLSVAIAKVENINVEKVLASRWSGKTFSQRIWTNTKLLNGVLRETISSGVHRGLSIRELAGNPELLKLSKPNPLKSVAENMRMAYRNSVRLVRTEMNFFNNQAHADSMADAGVVQYEFIATLDNRTSAACRSRDGETYPLEEKTVGFNYPPLHPRCRSTVCPFIEGVSRKGTRTAKVGGKNIDIPANMKYADYEKVYIKKEISLEDWRKNNLNNVATSGKMNNNDIVAPRKNSLQTGGVKDNMFSGAFAGALNPNSLEAFEHAKRYYGLVRKMKTDCVRIAKNTGFRVEDIQRIKSHVFYEKHNLDDGFKLFEPDYEMAQSWQRLIDGSTVEKRDIILLNHEFLESIYMAEGLEYEDAHEKAQEIYSYAAALREAGR